MIFRFIYISLCVLLTGCEGDREKSKEPLIFNEVKDLEAEEEKRLFLENMHEEKYKMRADLCKAKRI